MVAGAGRNHDEAAGAGPALVLTYAYNRLALDDVHDLVAVMHLRGAGILARRDRHDGGLAPLRLLEDAEELALVRGDVDDIHGTRFAGDQVVANQYVRTPSRSASHHVMITVRIQAL